MNFEGAGRERIADEEVSEAASWWENGVDDLDGLFDSMPGEVLDLEETPDTDEEEA